MGKISSLILIISTEQDQNTKPRIPKSPVSQRRGRGLIRPGTKSVMLLCLTSTMFDINHNNFYHHPKSQGP